ncbi:hypothetical protein AVEN_116623-1 [Araneus ventricosus]|uniref:Uncharacterized protein n=1 Tax=Araneus ventricosus TaxID=182803 RepID=A0A4Y2DE93_ARAVE|nr:hypothetical protein AVEN_116623-1 [Araneus ventricosus]
MTPLLALPSPNFHTTPHLALGVIYNMHIPTYVADLWWNRSSNQEPSDPETDTSPPGQRASECFGKTPSIKHTDKDIVVCMESSSDVVST